MVPILAYDNFKCIFLNKNGIIPIRFSPKFVPRTPIDNKPALVNVMAWRQQAISHYLNQCWPSSLAHISCCEHHQFCRSALSITPMRVLSTVGRGRQHGLITSPHLIPPLTTTRLCLLSSLLAQHQKPLSAPFMQDDWGLFWVQLVTFYSCIWN